jgi:hypothetical protein
VLLAEHLHEERGRGDAGAEATVVAVLEEAQVQDA